MAESRASTASLNVLVLGAGGNFGQLLLRRLRESLPGETTLLAGIDVVPRDRLAQQPDLYLQQDLTAGSGEDGARLLRQADWILCALPQAATFRVIDEALGFATPGALFADILSVKGEVVARMRERAPHLELVSLHPMFAAGVDFPRQNVAAVAVRPGPRQRQLAALIASWGARLTWMDAAEHDTATAVIQAATHAAVLAFAASLEGLGHDVAKALTLATPPHRTLLAMAARILAGDPEVYWKIQRGNPQATRAREALLASVGELAAAAAAGDEESFRGMLERGRRSLGSALEPLQEHCKKVYGIPFDG